MKKFIICKGFMAIINFDANSDISFEQSNLYLSHDISRFITSDKVFQKIANCIGSFLKGDWGCINCKLYWLFFKRRLGLYT